MFNLNIEQIAETLKGTVLNFDFNKIKVTNSVVSNHVDVQKNSIFIAIKGEKFDGHNFVKQAINKGACLAIVEQKASNIPQIIVPDTKIALLKIAALNRQQFSGPVIAVTGSFGKTTVKDLIACVLSQQQKILKTQANLNNEIGVAQTMLNLNSQHKTAIIELGMSHKNEISMLSQAVKPTIGVITNIGQSHFENFKNLNEILQAKLELLDGMPSYGPIFFNADDPKLNANLFTNHPTVSCSIKNNKADFYADNITQTSNLLKFTAHYKNKSADFEIPLIGKFNALNSIIAIAIGHSQKISIEKIQQALRTFKPTGLRQKLLKFNSITIFADCYNASPETTTTALKAFSKMQCKGKKIAVIGDMLELGTISQIAHEKIGILINQLQIDEIICFGELSKYICNKTKKPAHHFKSIDKLIYFVKNRIKPNDLIMFKASHAMNFEKLINKIFKNINYN